MINLTVRLTSIEMKFETIKSTKRVFILNSSDFLYVGPSVSSITSTHGENKGCTQGNAPISHSFFIIVGTVGHENPEGCALQTAHFHVKLEII